jgi:hypothetical protein
MRGQQIGMHELSSRPSFKDILLERVPGIAPSDNYKNLDF